MSLKTTKIIVGVLCMLLSAGAWAQDEEGGAAGGKAPVEVFDEDRIEVEADLPRVDFILDFKGLRYESLDKPEDFIPELLESVEDDPF